MQRSSNPTLRGGTEENYAKPQICYAAFGAESRTQDQQGPRSYGSVTMLVLQWHAMHHESWRRGSTFLKSAGRVAPSKVRRALF